MIRFLQRDSRVVKAFFVVVIAAASVGMVVYLIPGLMSMGATSADEFAVVYPHWYSRFLSSGATVSQQRVSDLARQQLQRRDPQLAGNPMIQRYFEQQIGAQLVQQQVLLIEAQKMGIRATDDDVSQFLHRGEFGAYLFPNGQFIGTDRYADFVATQFNLSVAEFEKEVKQDIQIHRLQTLMTAGIGVGNQEVRDLYRKQNAKIKFDYAVISADDLRKTINPSDAELTAFFKKNAARYATAVPEERKITYFAFTSNEMPGGAAQPSAQEVQQYYKTHQADYQVPEQARARHILIKVAAGADAKTDAAARAKAEGLLKQIRGGANFALLAKKNSDDPGSKVAGGELGFAKRGAMVPEFDKAIFSQKVGDATIVKTQFGYHIVQVEERQTAHTKPFSEVQPVIQATLARQKAARVEQDYAQKLTSEATKNGLAKTAAAHHLELTTTPLVGAQGVIAALPDGSQLMAKAFASRKGDPPQFASTGEGFAVFQVSAVVPAHAPNFAEYKSKIADDYRDEQLPGLLSRKTAELAAKAKSLNDLAKAAQQVGAAVKSSDLIDQTGQVPDLGQVSQVAPQLFTMAPGSFSGPINTGRTGVVAKVVSRQEPTADEITRNFDQARAQLLEQRRSEAFNVFLGTVLDGYKKHNRIQFPKTKDTENPNS